MTNPPSRFTPDGIHIALVRVYYEDTDTGGIVYYANYLKFAERARTEVLRDLGITQRALMEEDGLAFAVRRCEVDYLMPARLDDELEVHTTLRALGKASLDLDQAICRHDPDGTSRNLAHLMVRLAVIARDGRPTRLPVKIANLLQPLAVRPHVTAPVQPSTPITADVSYRQQKESVIEWIPQRFHLPSTPFRWAARLASICRSGTCSCRRTGSSRRSSSA